MNKDLLLLLLSSTQPRRIKLIQNLLNGKRTVSTLFWAMRYSILQYSAILKTYDLNSINGAIKKLIVDGLAEQVDEFQYQLTTKGQIKKDSVKESFYILQNTSYQYDYDVNEFKARILLAIQSVSEYSYQNKNYYPVKTDMKSSMIVKRWFIQNKVEIVSRLEDYLTKYLSQVDEKKANIIAQQMIGHDVYGMTNGQLADSMGVSNVEAFFMEYDGWVDFINYIINDDDQLLLPLINDVRTLKMNHHAIQTYNQFVSGNTLDQIANNLSVKLSTVREHLLEMAIWLPESKFPYAKIVSAEDEKTLRQAFDNQPIDDWQFRQISESTDINFFEFRIYQILRSKQDVK
ncbi:helix-turn-helix domain-containing protein [Apilactobacillus kunkeei]|uniref:helix-turn-helix domain-containing protein n=1 Tax=Apilactobacillus kunkeei TaxID=148814 RepID=UPI00200A1D83|nr:helix-turn-helix domain-containing protein [Apilactobacillus kunkeei]MCK8618331.1 helix-turn-helix domain-containing protein [Apilactobacillus kunkeei]